MDMYGLGSASWSGDLMEDSMDMAKLGASALVGAGIAKAVTEVAMVRDFAGGWVGPFLPIAIGIGIHNRAKGAYPVAAPGIAAGMVAVGVGKLVGKLLSLNAKAAEFKSYVPFAGLGSTIVGNGAPMSAALM